MEIHKLQMLVLRELLFKPNARFSDLNIQGLSSDHFSYHINSLLDQKLVEKTSEGYRLTTKGKEFANTMDTDDVVVEKQPKIAVMLVVSRYIDGNKQLLVQIRKKEPYFNYVGFLTGKIRFGETIVETAQRELLEETGLKAENFTIKGLVHDHVFDNDKGNLLEDKIFFIIEISETYGELVDTQSGVNRWISEDEYYKLDKKFYNEDNIYEISKKEKPFDFLEAKYIVQEF